jgi:nucleotide-binding universal stress UspA family protein
MNAVGDGPVLLAADGRHDARAALRFARRFARRLDRAVEVVHVCEPPPSPGVEYIPACDLLAMHEHYRIRCRDRLRRWLAAERLTDMRCIEVEGGVVSRILDVARQREACLVVCASRTLSAVDRLFNSSVGAHLAAVAPCAVAVVPPSPP